MKDKIILSAAIILIICVVLFLIYSISILTFDNVKLKGYARTLESNISSLNAALRHYQDSARASDKSATEALNYIKWRFVLKEQAEDARKRLTAKTKEISDLKKNKEDAALLYYNLGLSCVLASDFDSAITSFEEALRNDPKDSGSLYSIGLLYSAYRKDPAKAAGYYKKYLELVPNGSRSDEARDRIRDLR